MDTLRQTRDEPCADRIDDIREHDRRAMACLLQRRHTLALAEARMTSGASRTNSAAYVRWRSALAAGHRNVDPHVAAVGPAQLL
jgi:hypothetical protein